MVLVPVAPRRIPQGMSPGIQTRRQHGRPSKISSAERKEEEMMTGRVRRSIETHPVTTSRWVAVLSVAGAAEIIVLIARGG